MDTRISFFLMIIISTSPTVPGQPSPRFYAEAWLPFRNCEMDYLYSGLHLKRSALEEGITKEIAIVLL